MNRRSAAALPRKVASTTDLEVTEGSLHGDRDEDSCTQTAEDMCDCVCIYPAFD